MENKLIMRLKDNMKFSFISKVTLINHTRNFFYEFSNVSIDNDIIIPVTNLPLS